MSLAGAQHPGRIQTHRSPQRTALQRTGDFWLFQVERIDFEGRVSRKLEAEVMRAAGRRDRAGELGVAVRPPRRLDAAGAHRFAFGAVDAAVEDDVDRAAAGFRGDLEHEARCPLSEVDLRVRDPVTWVHARDA